MLQVPHRQLIIGKEVERFGSNGYIQLIGN